MINRFDCCQTFTPCCVVVTFWSTECLAVVSYNVAISSPSWTYLRQEGTLLAFVMDLRSEDTPTREHDATNCRIPWFIRTAFQSARSLRRHSSLCFTTHMVFQIILGGPISGSYIFPAAVARYNAENNDAVDYNTMYFSPLECTKPRFEYFSKLSYCMKYSHNVFVGSGVSFIVTFENILLNQG